MRVRLIKSFVTMSLILTGLSGSALGQRASSGASIRQTETLMIRIETKLDILKDEAERVAASSSDPDQDVLGQHLMALEQSAARMRETFDARDPMMDDVNDVLMAARQVDQYLARNRVSVSAQSQWRSLKRDLSTLATYNRISWNWNQVRPPVVVPAPSPAAPAYTGTESQMRTLASRIALKTGIYKTQMQTALRTDDTVDLSDEEVFNYISAFETASNKLKQRFDIRQSTATDASDVLMAATYIDQFMNRNRLTPAAQAQWRNLRGDLSSLASSYRVSWDWNQTLTNTATIGLRNFDKRITGTYRLNTSLSEDTDAVVNRAMVSVPAANREDARVRLERRLRSPDMIAIEMNNKSVTLASTILPQVTFLADGVARSETNANGRTITTTATVDGDGVIVNYQGERASDFYLTFLPMADGKLKVTRRIFTESSGDGVTVSSVYDKVDNVARWATVTTGSNTGGSGIVEDSFVIPNGTRFNAELTTAITGPQMAERFTMEVTSPGQYRRAVITGRVLAENAASRVAGQTRVLLAFDTIRLPSGKTHRFAGSVDAVTTVNGEAIAVSNQIATTRPGNQPTRGGAGGILGALIGAIAGVPVDSAGASASTAGAVLSQRGDVINLAAGTQIMITATLPRN
ncbi:MAG: hypothetical protein WKF34_06595 [Pyrinomonadaceae bacterium]